MVKESTRVVRAALPEGLDAKVQDKQTRRVQQHDGLGGLNFFYLPGPLWKTNFGLLPVRTK
jgi:hypothetical protein